MLLSLVGFVGFAIACMIGNIVTGGAVFGTPWVVPLLVLVVVVLAARRIAPDLRSLRWTPATARAAAPWLLAGLVLGWLYVWPMLEAGSGARTGDIPSHLGWTSQLLGGEPVPVGAAPEVPDNAYPWGLHAVMATLVRAVPGTEALAAVDALHLLIVVALPLAAACLARRVRHDAGWATATCFALIGGLGWLVSSGPAFVLSPQEARYGADLVVASPNSLYELFPSSAPRELALALLGATGVLLILARTANDGSLWGVAGVCAGLTGLVSVPLFV
jgi:hypothetical protein